MIKPQPIDVFFETDHYEAHWLDKANTHHFCNDLLLHCLYGQVGDRLWVRETWAVHYSNDKKKPSWINPTGLVYYKAQDLQGIAFIGKWRPSIFMPRWASRILLEITKIRVEKLQDISEEDAKAEGLKPFNASLLLHRNKIFSAGEQYVDLWDSLNAKRGYGWDKNPWVWVIEFKLSDTTKSNGDRVND